MVTNETRNNDGSWARHLMAETVLHSVVQLAFSNLVLPYRTRAMASEFALAHTFGPSVATHLYYTPQRPRRD